ncbi:hypothetical protein RhiirA1_529629 [Rhizophagus irregularis]|uniref:Uncharacterized protein n=1 Tax=Rhizophagus irregularis TaxID=588596 RepID=A0A2I1ELP4_9GLOM|nr:hypothetical protein RhiirA1_529629 [Rhizophagus irregularis]PKY23041.1 hypothetical protein RhiirB3_437140 [Rhizophagus irregularis]
MNISSEQANLIIPHVLQVTTKSFDCGPTCVWFCKSGTDAFMSSISSIVHDDIADIINAEYVPKRFNDYVALRDKLRANDYVGKYELILEFSLIESFVFNKLWFYWLIVLYIVVLELLNDFNGQS